MYSHKKQIIGISFIALSLLIIPVLVSCSTGAESESELANTQHSVSDKSRVISQKPSMIYLEGTSCPLIGSENSRDIDERKDEEYTNRTRTGCNGFTTPVGSTEVNVGFVGTAYYECRTDGSAGLTWQETERYGTLYEVDFGDYGVESSTPCTNGSNETINRRVVSTSNQSVP